MIRTVIQYSQRFAGLMLLAVLAANVAPAQSQTKKAVLEKQPATKDVKAPLRETAKKPAERILEVDKSPARRAIGEPDDQQGLLVKTPSGVSPKVIVDPHGGQKTIAVGEPNGGIRRRVEEPANVPEKKLKEVADGPQRQRGELGPLTPVTKLPQRTKDAAGSPQKEIGKQEAGNFECRGCKEEQQRKVPSGVSPKGDLKKQAVEDPAELRRLKVVRGDQQGRRILDDGVQRPKETTDLRRTIKLDPIPVQDPGKGTIIERKPKEEPVELLKKKKAEAKENTKRAGDAPSLIKRKR